MNPCIKLTSNFLFLLLFLVFSSPNLFSQDGNREEPITLKQINGEKIAVDMFGNLYVVQDAILHKYDMKGKLLYSYSNFSLGSITSIDVNNPMKILIFYREPAVIVLLNDRLSPITDRIDLFNKQYTTISLACYSSDNNFWLYDHANNDLISIDVYYNQKNKIHYSFPASNPIQLFESQDKMIILNCTGEGIYLFDSFGTYIKTIGVQTRGEVQIINNTIYYLKENALHAYNYRELKEEVIPLQVPDIVQCIRYRNNFYLLDKNGTVFIY